MNVNKVRSFLDIYFSVPQLEQNLASPPNTCFKNL